jgi:hypothetical protein
MYRRSSLHEFDGIGVAVLQANDATKEFEH